jgi:uncharacterized protein
MTPVELAVVAVVVFAAAMVQTTTGFGFALLAVPLLSLVVPTETAVVISASLGLVTIAGLAVKERAHGDRVAIRRMLLGAMVGAPLGLLVLEVVSSRQLKFLLAGVIFVFLLITLRGWALTKDNVGVEVGAGLVSGVLNTVLSTNGPPLVMALQARHLPPEQFRGTLAPVVAVTGVITVALFAVTGRYDSEAWVSLLVALPALGLGYLAGTRQHHRFDPAVFRRLVLVLLGVTGMVTLVGAILA